MFKKLIRLAPAKNSYKIKEIEKGIAGKKVAWVAVVEAQAKGNVFIHIKFFS